jgi:hypothetical protein
MFHQYHTGIHVLLGHRTVESNQSDRFGCLDRHKSHQLHINIRHYHYFSSTQPMLQIYHYMLLLA